MGELLQHNGSAPGTAHPCPVWPNTEAEHSKPCAVLMTEVVGAEPTVSASTDMASTTTLNPPTVEAGDVKYVAWKDESQMTLVMSLIEKDLSEPYSIFTYRYFINNWPKLCFLAMVGDQCVGCVVNKLEKNNTTDAMRGYIAMLAVDKDFRNLKIGTTL